MRYIMQNCVTEWCYDLIEKKYEDPFNDVEIKAVVTDPDGQEMIIPGFWCGGGQWRIRYSSPVIGIHRYKRDY